MLEPERTRALAAAGEVATGLGLDAAETVLVQDSNKLTLRLLPCDVLARVAPASHRITQFEIDVASQLAAAGAPVAALDPRTEARVHARDGFDVTLWTYYEPLPGELDPVAYAAALQNLHKGLRTVDVPSPRFTDRIDEALGLAEDPERTPGLADDDRDLLATTLRDLRRAILERGAAEQLLHGEPHSGNLLATAAGPRFIDFETCCRGPVEFDLAHAPDPVADHYPGLDRDLLRDCRIVKLAMITMWRWDPEDTLPDGERLAAEWTAEIRDALDPR
ncbi:phosphotransferase family protein [Glycomyces paridis]|uniref:Aminoglycoside phosphotransferase family protein n=1 Tax=Glycomyces paridis TaxID=2126555 RepID=A0A4S8P902_9ACTN|nr:aminoglycoside phosphotransferase family protein [Glycomyces paridis]